MYQDNKYRRYADNPHQLKQARPDCGGIDSSVSGARMINIAEDGSITTEMTYYDFRQDVTAVPDSVWETSIAGNVGLPLSETV